VTPLQRARLEKAAADSGFELTPELQGGQLVLRSAQFPEAVTVEPLVDPTFALTIDSTSVIAGTGLPDRRFQVDGYDALYTALERAAATARTLPNRVSERFRQTVASMPKSTEAERIVIQRVGQQLFRDALLDYWQGRCCVTGLAVPDLLRASHIKPWAMCDDDNERLDVYNGLLLAPQLDAIFDGGWATFEPTGELRIADGMERDSLDALGIRLPMKVTGLIDRHQRYLDFHRRHVYRTDLAAR